MVTPHIRTTLSFFRQKEKSKSVTAAGFQVSEKIS